MATYVTGPSPNINQVATTAATRQTATVSFSPQPIQTNTPTTQTAPSGSAPVLQTAAPAAPSATTAGVVTTAGVWHDVTRPSSTAGSPLGEQYPTAPDMGARYGAYDRAMQTPSVYGGRIESEYGAPQTGPLDVGQMIGMVGGRSQWDWQREQVQGDWEREKQRQIEALDASLARQGITGAAAVNARNDLIRRLEQQRSQALNQINAQEAGYLGEAAQALQAQRYQTQERLGEQAFQADLSYSQLGQRERELAEQARQYDNKYDFDVWSTRMGYTDKERNRVWQAIQNDEDRSLTAQELQSKIDSMRNSLVKDYEELRASTGVERDRIAYNIWAKQQDIASSERALEYRSWADQQLQTLKADLDQRNWYDQTAIAQRQQSWYNVGKAGVEIDDAQLQALKDQDPLAYYAYMDGRANLSQAVFNSNMELRTAYLNTAMGSLAELTGQDFINAMKDVWQSVNELFAPGGPMSTTQLIPAPGSPSVGGEYGGTPTAIAAVEGAGQAGGTTARAEPVSTGTLGGWLPHATRRSSAWSSVGEPAYYSATIGEGDRAYNMGVRLTQHPTYQGQVGNTVMVRGVGTGQIGDAYASGNCQTATYTPRYAYGSPESSSYIEGINEVGPYGAQNNQYLYDGATMQTALGRTMSMVPYLQPVTIGGYNGEYVNQYGGLTPQTGLALMLMSTGRYVATESGVVNPNPQAWAEMHGFAPPSAENMAIIDTDYLQSLADDGSPESIRQLLSLGYTWANIGGYPYALIPSYDPLTGRPTNGLMAVSVHNPAVTIRWEAKK